MTDTPTTPALTAEELLRIERLCTSSEAGLHGVHRSVPLSLLSHISALSARATAAEKALEGAREKNAKLRGALKPFAEVADWIERNGHDPDDLDTLLRGKEGRILGHFQVQPIDCMRARATLT